MSAEILEEKAKIKSDPDDAGYYDTNIRLKGAKVSISSCYPEDAEIKAKEVQKAVKRMEKVYSKVVEAAAVEIYNEWIRDHGERVSKDQFVRGIFKSKILGNIIAIQDDYGFMFEITYKVEMLNTSKELVLDIYTDKDGYVTSYKYSTEK